jgi:pimeloyl-ACP methyl ester carboxylesterase
MASLCYYKTRWSPSIVAKRYGMTLERCMPDAVFPWYCASDPKDGTRYVAISGTNAWGHWRTNARINQERLFDGLDISAHAGATRMVRAMMPEVRAVLHDAPRVVFLGHSIGGSMACLFAMVLREEFGIESVRALTFGSPPVLSRRVPEAPVDNILIDLDVVPRILTAMYHYGGSLYVLQPRRNNKEPFHSSMPGRPGAFRVDSLSGMESFCPPPSKIAEYHLSHTYTRVLRDLHQPRSTLHAS